MASYSSYKKVIADNFGTNAEITDDKFQQTAGKTYGVLWVKGGLGFGSGGACCLWTVPPGVKRITFDAWGSGGNGAGACSCNRCHHYKGAGGGYYNTVTVSTIPGCQYTICAGGVFPCCSFECVGCNGCSSYVNGYNLSNFCAIGGDTGRAETDWSNPCFSDWSCCLGPGANGGNFGMGNHNGAWTGWWLCHCFRNQFESTGAPFLTAGGNGVLGNLNECWMRCGCWNVPYATGGQSAMSTYCGSSCCGTGGTGGPGVVKVTYS